MTTWLLLRGLTRGAGHWGSFVGRFKEAMPHSQVIALDLPGNGVLHQQRSATTVSEMVAQCRCQLSVRAIAPPYHVLAMSLGAMVAVEWASSYPQDIAASVLINTSLRPYNPFYQRLRPDNYMTLLKLMLGRPGPLAWEQAILRMTSNQNPSNALSEWVALRERFNVSRRNALAQLAAAARYSAPAHPPSCSMLLLVSDKDRLVSAACSEAIAQRWQCTLRRHGSAGHDLPLDDGPWVIDQTRNWIQHKDLERTA